MTGTERHTGEALAALMIEAVRTLKAEAGSDVVRKLKGVVTDGASAQVCAAVRILATDVEATLTLHASAKGESPVH